MLSGLALKTKITLFAIAMFIALSAIALLGLQSLRHASESDNIARINQLMKSTTNIVEQFELMVKNNQLEEGQAKNSLFRYFEKINTTTQNMCMSSTTT